MSIHVSSADGTLLNGGTVIKVRSEQTRGALAVVETTLRPKALIEQHVHANDVWIYVLAGEVGVLVGDQMASGAPGSWLLKPRDIPHAMWNATSLPARVMEVLTPAGSEGYFIEGAGVERARPSTRWQHATASASSATPPGTMSCGGASA